MKSKIQNQKGLHRRYHIQKIAMVPNHNYIPYAPTDGNIYGKHKISEPEFIEQLIPVDKDAEYFVLRLDTGDSDIKHIKACRIALHEYAKAIHDHLPELSVELVTKYPLL